MDTTKTLVGVKAALSGLMRFFATEREDAIIKT